MSPDILASLINLLKGLLQALTIDVIMEKIKQKLKKVGILYEEVAAGVLEQVTEYTIIEENRKQRKTKTVKTRSRIRITEKHIVEVLKNKPSPDRVSPNVEIYFI